MRPQPTYQRYRLKRCFRRSDDYVVRPSIINETSHALPDRSGRNRFGEYLTALDVSGENHAVAVWYRLGRVDLAYSHLNKPCERVTQISLEMVCHLSSARDAEINEGRTS